MTGYDRQWTARLRVLGDGGEKPLRVGMTRVFQYHFSRPALHDSAGIHDGGAMGMLRDNPHIMGDQEKTHLEFLLDSID